MATLIDVYNQVATNSTLRSRVAAAIGASAWAIFEKESPTSGELVWAKDAISTVEAIAMSWMWAVCGNVAVQAADFNPTDGDIQYIVNTIRDDVIAEG